MLCVLYFFSYDYKQDAITKVSHSKQTIELLKEYNILLADLITIWKDIYGFSKKYICATELYLLQMLAYAYNIIIYRGVGAPGHGRDVLDSLNTTAISPLSMLMSKTQLFGSRGYDNKMTINTSTHK